MDGNVSRLGKSRMNRENEVGARLRRSLTIVTGIAVLIWSGFEDNDAALVTILGALSATSVTMTICDQRFLRDRLSGCDVPIRAAFTGALIGALAGLATPLLMLFKDLRHAHIFPDYPPGMMLDTLVRLPIWALAGALAGFGIASLLEILSDWYEDPSC